MVCDASFKCTATVSPGATPAGPCRLPGHGRAHRIPRRSLGGAEPPHHPLHRRRRHRARHLARRPARVRRHRPESVRREAPDRLARGAGGRESLQAGRELAGRCATSRACPARCASRRSSTWSFSARTSRMCTPGSSTGPAAQRPMPSSDFSASGSRPRSAPGARSASSRCPSSAPSAWSRRRSSTRCVPVAARSRSFTRATS